ncbi:hypothetical protein CASFOL_027319 [Castilleja foliolosa]|uniref:Uncharacterized protein n=1 Tax=Castilleja foliolosa TaxID=1961234 RepID=A0ABD3CEH1_9LAMI
MMFMTSTREPTKIKGSPLSTYLSHDEPRTLVVGAVTWVHRDLLGRSRGQKHQSYSITDFDHFLRLYLPCPPYRLSYHGLGEPLSFAANGPFCTIAFYLLQGTSSEQPISGTIISASILIEDDKAVGKFSPSFVRLDSENGSKVVKMGVLGLYWLVLGLGFAQALRTLFLCFVLCTMTLPMGNLVVSFVEKNHKDKSKIFMAKYYCVRLHALFGVVLAVGLVASRLIHYGEQFENLLAFFDRAN